ncbi:L,D-transpeptidase family protein [Paenibacillus riograndensis]|uniref:ErfK/YbiS/YcfS/YnhG family protein n=2 Tax=Paenibacillus riograndensis TaxID=483937 RepID=A0A0E4H935_9BACL|nr:L,D-transpeptidase [Paenibacillus riograndensis]CQR54975.1 ErfK/YbiS/YcfS/YnhG family protein [Paenibacillus riograndensis SBR5]
MKNSQHLKAYVQMHPDNKMAWYLLGKEYYKNGQHGKANYCFNQAGEVYEAFEHSKVPAEMLREYEEGLIRENRQRHESRLRLRRGLLALLLLLLMLIPSAVAPGVNLDESGASVPEAAAGDLEEPVAAKPTEEEASPVPAVLAFTAAGEDAASAGQALAAALKNREAPSKTAMLAMKKSGRWLIWKKNLPLAAVIEKSANGKVVYQSYDPAACACEPPEAGGLKKQAQIWQGKQEELAALWSAIRSYNSSKGKPPESLKELTRPFPENVMGKTTPLMKQEFAALRAALALQPLQASPQPSPAVTTEGTAAGNGTVEDTANRSKGQPPFFSSPLAIIVDKQNHRLAVTSGNIILRNYAVGLGGEKTPEGEFVISDKVVNPNGHDNGEFGSRGMQLSDTNYAIHGTNEPDSIGKDESLGCIRMKREDVEELFAMVPMGTKVQISKGVLPDELLLPDERYPSGTPLDQTNPNKVYHWLN